MNLPLHFCLFKLPIGSHTVSTNAQDIHESVGNRSPYRAPGSSAKLSSEAFCSQLAAEGERQSLAIRSTADSRDVGVFYRTADSLAVFNEVVERSVFSRTPIERETSATKKCPNQKHDAKSFRFVVGERDDISMRVQVYIDGKTYAGRIVCVDSLPAD